MNTYSSGPLTLNERLYSVGVKTILIVNRHGLDAVAAMTAAKPLTRTRFQFCCINDAIMTIRSINPAQARHMLVIADLDIDLPAPGLRAVEAALWRKAFAFAIASGPLSVRLLPCFDVSHNRLRGHTSDPHMWSSILQAFCKQASAPEGFLRNIASVWRNTGEIHSIIVGETIKQIREEIAAAVLSDRAQTPALVSAR